MLNTSLSLLLFYQGHTLLDELPRVDPYAINQLLQDEFLILSFEKREVGFNPIEVRRVRNVEDCPYLEPLACLCDCLCLVHSKVIHEKGKLISMESLA